MGVQNILVPVELDPLSDAALARAVALARPFGASILLLHVIRTYPPQVLLDPGVLGAPIVLQQPQQPPVDDLRSRLIELACRQTVPGVPIRDQVEITDQPVAATILRVAREARSDLIVMSTHGRGGIDRVVLGSVAEAVVRHAELPLLLIPAGATSKDGQPSERQEELGV
jgi:nucleotide-binding universal stress UspA family protein